MEILLAVAVMAVAVTSWFTTTTFRNRIRENTTQLTATRDQLTSLQRAGKQLGQQQGDQRKNWSDDFEAVRQRLGEITKQLDQQRTATSQLGAALQAEAGHREHDAGRLWKSVHDEMAVQLGQGLETESEQRRQEIQLLHQAIRDLDRRAGQAEEVQTRAQAETRSTTTGLADFRQQAEPQLAGLAMELAHLDRHLRDIRRYIHTQLDNEVAATRQRDGDRVIVGGIYAEQPAASDVLPLLYESFAAELPVELLFHDSTHQFNGRFYLHWSAPDGQPPERCLSDLLAACLDDGDNPPTGVTELRGLLLALHHAGPGVLQVGPLVAVRTDDSLVAAVLSGEQAAQLDGQAAVPAPKDCQRLLETLTGGELTDLGPWADRQAS
jgi:hypothetical protein